MPRARTGSAFPHGDHFDIQITLPDGTRGKRACLPKGITLDEARAEAARLTELVWKHGGRLAGPVEEGETVRDWADRWFAWRERRGLEQQDAERSRWGKWIQAAPVRDRVFGDLAIAGVTAEDLEDVVSHLDASVRKEALSWKTAANAWALVTSAFSDAKDAKDRSVRARKDNPARDVRGPDRGARKAKAWLHPREVLAVLENAAEPLSVRRALALNVYLYSRPGELRALTWDDVDLESGRVTFHRAIRRDGTEKGTKTGEVRTVPIEPTLQPLLGAMREAANGRGTVIDLPSDTTLADVLRAALHRAGVARPDLFATTRTRKQVTWYDLRATGITWRAIRGDNPIAIMQHAGHEDFKTTQRYIREAEAMGANFGDVFPPLPPELFESGEQSALGASDLNRSANRSRSQKTAETQWVDRDSNPDQIAPKKPIVEANRSAPTTDRDGPGVASTTVPDGPARPPSDSETVPAAEQFHTGPPSDSLNRNSACGGTVFFSRDIEATLERMLALAVDAGDLDAAKRVLAELEHRRRDAAPNVVTIDRRRRTR